MPKLWNSYFCIVGTYISLCLRQNMKTSFVCTVKNSVRPPPYFITYSVWTSISFSSQRVKLQILILPKSKPSYVKLQILLLPKSKRLFYVKFRNLKIVQNMRWCPQNLLIDVRLYVCTLFHSFVNVMYLSWCFRHLVTFKYNSDQFICLFIYLF